MTSSSTARASQASAPRLVDEQVRLLYGALPSALAGNAFIAGLLGVVQWPVVSHPWALSWFGVMAVVLLLRAALFIAFRRLSDDASLAGDAWLVRFRVGAIATGVAWGLSGVLMFPTGHLAHEVFLAFVLAGVSSGAITSLSADRWSALGFVAPALLPMVLAFFREGGTMAVAMGLMGAAYLLFITANSVRLQRRLFENLRLRVEANDRRQRLASQQKLTEVIARAQSEFIREPDRRRAFDGLLTDVLDLTGSEYGFIGEVLRTADGALYLKTYAITNIAWNDETRAFYEKNAPSGMEFTNLETLFGAALKTGTPVFSNNPAQDVRGGGLPDGHPPLNAFLGIPVFRGGEMVAMLGLANRIEGYDEELLEFLHPLLVTLGQLVEAARVQQEHLESERRLRGIIEGTRIGTWEWNIQTGAVVFNERWAEIVGYTLEELAPVTIQTWMELAHPEDLQVSESLLQGHFDGDLDYYDCQCRMRHRDGHWVWVHDRGRVVAWTENGDPLVMSGTHADITEQKLAESSLQEQVQHTRAIVENIVDGIVTIDSNGIIESFNPAAERVFGYRAEEVVGRNVKVLMPSPYADAHDTSIANYQVTGEARVIGTGREVEGQRKDGDLFPMELAVSEITRGGRPMYVGMVRDITERKRIDRMKSEFVSTVSHELRTPLTSISGALGLVSQGALGELPEQAQEMVAIAHKNSERLTRLINDLLDIEKLAVGQMHFDMLLQPLAPLIAQAMDVNRGYGARRDVRLTLINNAADVVVRVDSHRLMQVMSNLLSNAIKYSAEHGAVEVSVEQRSGNVRVTVTDHGPGIPVQFRDRIFQKFAQADSSDTRPQGGTGLGLAITRELVEKMGGEVDFDSVEGQGARFYFDLPVESYVPEDTATHMVPQALRDAARLLLVEPEPQSARFIEHLLTRAGYSIDRVTTGAEAMRAIETSNPDVVVLDLFLPDMSGLELIRQVHQDRLNTTPMLLVSANLDERGVALNSDLSSLNWLSRPYDEDQLRSTVQRLVTANATQRPRVLQVTTDESLRRKIQDHVGEHVRIELAGSLAQARDRISAERWDAVIVDLALPDGSGWTLLPEIRERQPGARVIIVSGPETTLQELGELKRVLFRSHVSPQRLLNAIHRCVNSRNKEVAHA